MKEWFDSIAGNDLINDFMDRVFISSEQLEAIHPKLDGSSYMDVSREHTGKYDTEFINLNTIWHDVSEEPEKEKFLLGIDEDGFSVYCWGTQSHSWKEFSAMFHLRKWLYTEDLIPAHR